MEFNYERSNTVARKKIIAASLIFHPPWNSVCQNLHKFHGLSNPQQIFYEISRLNNFHWPQFKLLDFLRGSWVNHKQVITQIKNQPLNYCSWKGSKYNKIICYFLPQREVQQVQTQKAPEWLQQRKINFYLWMENISVVSCWLTECLYSYYCL